MKNLISFWSTAVAAVSAGCLFSSVAGDFEVPYSGGFDLGPGETQFNLVFPKFNPASYAGATTLNEVVVELDVTFSAGLALDSANGTVQWSLGPALTQAVALPGLLLPPPASVTLSGETTVPAGQTVIVDPPPSAQKATLASVTAPNVGAYLWSAEAPTVAYDVDFAGLYSVVTTSPASAAGVFWSDRVNGTLTVTYKASTPSPTATVLLALGAAVLDPGTVLVNWRTGVESNLTGFLLDRRLDGGEWTRLTPASIPAVGSGRPESYSLTDSLAGTALEVRYRLLQVDLRGEVSTLGETTVVRAPRTDLVVRGGNLELTVTGEPDSQVTVQTTVDATRGPWIRVGPVPLDSSGQGSFLLPLSFEEVARFYRLIVE